MARRYEIDAAFRSAVKINTRTGRTVTTRDFTTELAKVNWHWTLAEANRWIEHHVDQFRDISTQEGDDRTFMLFNPNVR